MPRHRIAKFRSLVLAWSYANHCIYPVTPVLGDDGRFLVPATNADWKILLDGGYEAADLPATSED